MLQISMFCRASVQLVSSDTGVGVLRGVLGRPGLPLGFTSFFCKGFFLGRPLGRPYAVKLGPVVAASCDLLCCAEGCAWSGACEGDGAASDGMASWDKFASGDTLAACSGSN